MSFITNDQYQNLNRRVNELYRIIEKNNNIISNDLIALKNEIDEIRQTLRSQAVYRPVAQPEPVKTYTAEDLLNHIKNGDKNLDAKIEYKKEVAPVEASASISLDFDLEKALDMSFDNSDDMFYTE